MKSTSISPAPSHRSAANSEPAIARAIAVPATRVSAPALVVELAAEGPVLELPLPPDPVELLVEAEPDAVCVELMMV